MSEIIYVLINEAMPGYVKIGMTNNSVLERLKQLDRTNIPMPFECYYACEVGNAHKEERWLHSIFSDRRVRDEREFFKIDPERVVAAVRRIQKKDVTPKDFVNVTKEEESELEGAKKKERVLISLITKYQSARPLFFQEIILLGPKFLKITRLNLMAS